MTREVNMNEYLQIIVYIILGCIGGAWHWVKKRYIDNTIVADFVTYLQTDKSFTVKALATIVAAEYSLSGLNAEHILHLNDVIGAITAGYMADSHLNRCNEIISAT